MQNQNMKMAILQTDSTIFLKVKKICQTRHLFDSKSQLNSQGQVMTNIILQPLPEFLIIAKITPKNASSYWPHKNVCIHYNLPT